MHVTWFHFRFIGELFDTETEWFSIAELLLQKGFVLCFKYSPKQGWMETMKIL